MKEDANKFEYMNIESESKFTKNYDRKITVEIKVIDVEHFIYSVLPSILCESHGGYK